ncbi:MAG: AarF/UbiB family protein [Trueperaceae bacterium]|nr:AarF/UbiB family protein [Trueperaceae bacterium]
MAGRGRAIAATALRTGARVAWRRGFGLRRGDAASRAAAREVRRGLERLGPAFVKLGQLASVRPDLVPADLAFELGALRDRVAPHPAPAIRAVVARELGAAPDALFASWDDAPVASASIAQVHAATLARPYRPAVGPVLPAGTKVAVKVVKPGVEAALAEDVALAYRVVRLAARLPAVARLDPAALVAEVEASVARELDLRVEARASLRFARFFRDDPRILVPSVVGRHTTRRVLVTTFVDGWRLSDLGAAERAGVDAHGLAVHGATAFLRQVLELGAFHADLHPANLLVTPDGRIAYLDFGIVGTTTAAEREAIAQLLVATAFGDADRAVRASRALGLALPPDREAPIRAAVDGLLRTHLTERHPADLRGFALGVLRLLQRERVPIPPGYGLLLKSLVTVEGVARALVPDVDVVRTAAPTASDVLLRTLSRPERLRARAPAAVRAAVRELLA